MSQSYGPSAEGVSAAQPRKFTVPEIQARKGGAPLVMVTAYDAPSARSVSEAGVELILVGDSLGMVVLGHESTLRVTLEQMVHHARAVVAVQPRPLVVVDMPYLTYHTGPRDAVLAAGRLVQEGGAEAVKLEGGAKRAEVIGALVDAEIPVMGHLGLTPQSVLAMGGYRVQARATRQVKQLLDDAQALVAAGVFAIVLEGIPAEVARMVTENVPVPTIGIGAGVGCDGQVLVYHDLLGLHPGPLPRFVRRYANLHEQAVSAIRQFASDVRDGSFPNVEESYRLRPETAAALARQSARRRQQG